MRRHVTTMLAAAMTLAFSGAGAGGANQVPRSRVTRLRARGASAGGAQGSFPCPQGLAAGGGTWVGNERFVWAGGSGVLMQWTVNGGVAPLRSERWFSPSSSSDAQWRN